MAEPTLNPQAEREECAYKRALAGAIKTAINELVKIHTDEFEAVLNGNYGTSAVIHDRLRTAREHKALLIERYRDHVTVHGC